MLKALDRDMRNTVGLVKRRIRGWKMEDGGAVGRAWKMRSAR